MSLNGEVAIVTGGTGALGRVVVKTLLDHGAYVHATYRSAGRKEELDLAEHIDRLTPHQTNVTDEFSVQSLIQEVTKKHGRIDILVNTVGGYLGGAEVANAKADDWDSMMNVNLKSTFLCCKAVLPFMVQQNYGRIVNVAARPAVEKRFRVKNCAYAISKAGVVILTEIIAEEAKKYDINANCILPSTMDTPANRRNMPEADFRKWVTPEDVANVILFLAGHESKAISGAAIPVYGKA